MQAYESEFWELSNFKTITNLNNKFDAIYISVERCFPDTQLNGQSHRIGERVLIQFCLALTSKHNMAIIKVTLFSEIQLFTQLLKMP